ncbi:oxidoreductase, 2nitropropane dioxygenase subfamily protein [Acanthamoeba castellanii str. Neff]|uniref:Oxidoreductase, 2nitropropane dioxygenase subfamily protein n=1 Tax=Acanthamoeba castellanii (strain ATCC 30010 / Neff) TaxID=1257118 RepID=L8GKK4_ACACF|nr:oxidoreductase, 2nitropropane dioxygenase subfamily protein [Acanthamoeba castellanii str. Neff]ELR12721.1 oxidoreductase, 2nitropropane dioxygenase subfamily protein [Acanthamoeba castellanii str. Neff]
MATSTRLRALLPHMKHPIVAAPMAFVSGADLAVAVSRAHGLGFIAGGYDLPKLDAELHRARSLLGAPEGQSLPIGVGLFAWTSAADPSQARQLLSTILTHRPCALWLFAPAVPGADGFRHWVDAIHQSSSASSSSSSLSPQRPVVFAQVASVREALDAAEAGVDVVVAQGADAGGHGSKAGAGLISLVPEVRDALPPALPLLAAGGVMDGRGLAAVLALGADGAALGTRFLASREAAVQPGLQRAIIEASDGGQSTVRTRLFDEMRGTTSWPPAYDGRALRNDTVADWERSDGSEAARDELRAAYRRAADAGDYRRLVVWAGTGVGLARKVQPAGEIVAELVRECDQVVGQLRERVVGM